MKVGQVICIGTRHAFITVELKEVYGDIPRDCRYEGYTSTIGLGHVNRCICPATSSYTARSSSTMYPLMNLTLEVQEADAFST